MGRVLERVPSRELAARSGAKKRKTRTIDVERGRGPLSRRVASTGII